MSKAQKNTVKVWINGLSGRMGQSLKNCLTQDDRFSLVGGASLDDFEKQVDLMQEASLVIDFSSKDGSHSLAQFVHKQKDLSQSCFLLCTTGLSYDTLALWEEVAQKGSRVLVAPNTSLGVQLALRAAQKIAPTASSEGFDLVVEETHHRNKIDSPSGTALFLAEELAKQNSLKLETEANKSWQPGSLSVLATRGGGVFGEHTIRLMGDHEEITITHRAFSRELFAKGALFLGLWLKSQSSGFYHLTDVSF